MALFFMFRKLIVCYEIILYNINHESIKNIDLLWGGGFSSSYVTTRMQKQIKENHLENQVQIDFSPFSLMHEVIDQYDVVMCCPHLLMDIKLHFKDTGVPLYVLPPRMYGLMKLTEIVDDAKGVIDIYKQTKQNPVYFPGEENILRVTRINSYRHTHGGKDHGDI